MPPGKAILHDRDHSLSDNATRKRPRSCSSKAVWLPCAAISDRERPRQRRRQQPEYLVRYATREEQTLVTVRRSIATVADTLTDVVVRSTNDTFRSSCLSLLRVRDTRQLKDVVKRKLWKKSGEVSSLDGADGGPERSGFADGGATISCSTSDSQNMDSFDDLALNVGDAGTTQYVAVRYV